MNNNYQFNWGAFRHHFWIIWRPFFEDLMTIWAPGRRAFRLLDSPVSLFRALLILLSSFFGLRALPIPPRRPPGSLQEPFHELIPQIIEFLSFFLSDFHQLFMHVDQKIVDFSSNIIILWILTPHQICIDANDKSYHCSSIFEDVLF